MKRTALLAAALAAALIAPAGARAQDCPGADLPPAHDNVAEVRAATVCLVNHQRAGAGAAALAHNSALERTASDYAADMVARRYFGHTPPEGTSLADRTRPYWEGAHEWRVGEDLAWASTAPESTARGTVAAWMRSDSHREILLAADFRELGVGIALGTPHGHSSGATYAAHFGIRHVAQATWRSASPQRSATRRHSTARRCRRVARRKSTHRKRCRRVARRHNSARR